ncbi:MAG TPA: hypothetical protein VFG30_31000, partial [Polyangiales bacterium]|nr:hypothetical protein [Polyangiales bacterium]
IADTAALDDGLVRFRLEVESESIAEAVSSAVAAAGCKLRELHREQTSLEDVFATLTTADHAEESTIEPLAAAGSAAPSTEAQPGSPGDRA